MTLLDHPYLWEWLAFQTDFRPKSGTIHNSDDSL